MNIKKTLTSFLAVITLFSNVTPAFSYANNTKINNKNIVEKSSDDTINKLKIEEPIELNSADEIENPTLPKIYNYKWKYSVPLKDDSSEEKYKLFYQPYEVSVGENATNEEKKKINKKINLPDLAGYERPKGVDSYDITYDNIVKNSTTQHENLFFGEKNFKYTPKETTIKVRYKFQTLEDKNKYEDAKDLKDNGGLVKEYKVKTGEKYKIPKLNEQDEKKYAQGFVAEQNELFVTIPTTPNVEFIFHYNRNSFQLSFYSNGGSYVPNMTLFYGQTIPNIFEKPAPTKKGATFDGWELNQDITIKDGNTEKKLPKGTIIKEDEYPEGLENAMPSKNISLSAVWKENKTSSYAIQFWTQKAESDGYDYVGFKEVKDVKTGTIPNLDEMLPDGIKFPEIDEDLTKKDRQEELKKYYVRNVEKTKKENSLLTDDTNDKKESKIKRVDSTGNTTYNIYYDRQTYTILFEKSNKSAHKQGVKRPEVKMDIPNVGKFNSEKNVNKPYKITAKFGERLKGWPHDEWLLVNSENGDMDENSDEYKEQLKTKTKFPIGDLMYGWTFNTDPASEYFYRDIPPYWMTSKDFIDPYLSYTDNKKQQQLAKKVTNSVSTGEKLPERTISIGPDSYNRGKVYYVEYSMQGLPKDENDTSVPKLKFNPALAYWKTDTDSDEYYYTLPEIPGFKKQEDKVRPKDTYDFDDLRDKINDESNERNPDERPLFNYAPKNINGIELDAFGYIVAKYDREKYKLTLNTDPRDKNKTEEYGDVYYDMPLRKLHLDDKKTPAKPNDLPSNYVFRGWATDPKGFNLIKDENKKANEIEEEIKEAYKNIPDEYIENDDGKGENDDPNLKKESNAKKYEFKAKIEKLNSKLDGAEHRMPDHNLTVYAIWGAPDKVFDISFDLNDDNNSPAEWQINPEDLANYTDGEKIQTSIGYKPYYKPELDTQKSTNNKKVFTIDNALSIKIPQNPPKRKGHDFLGWELLTDNQTREAGYRQKYDAPKLYSFGNEIMSNIHLRAIWNNNGLEDVKVTHHLLSEDYNKDEQKETIIENQRSNVNATTYGQMQGEEHILLEEGEFESLDKDNPVKKLYEEYKQKTNQKNSYYQNLTVKNHDEAKEENFDNHFHFFYRPYRYRTYNVNYILLPNGYDKDKLNKTSTPYYQNKILTAKIKNGNRDFDAIDYEKIPGYKLVSDPQVQLFFEVDENSHKLIGMNGHKEAGFDQVNFYYKDMRVIKRKSANDKTPNGYHRVTFKANEGGNFGKDEKGKEIKEISYDVIDGLHFDKIKRPIPQGEDNYIFNKWENEALLEGKDEIKKDYTFNATFEKANDVIEVKDNSTQDIPKNYVDVFVDTGDKASESTRFKKHFKVTPKSSVTIPVDSPTGDSFKDSNGKLYQYNFTAWVQTDKDGSDIAKPLKWTKNNPITAKFTSTTYINAKYNFTAAKVDGRYIENNGSSPKPDGFVEVSFDKGDHGTISGKSSYFVNPKMKVKLKELVHPTVKADDGYTFDGWNKDDDLVIDSYLYVIAKYKVNKPNNNNNDNNSNNNNHTPDAIRPDSNIPAPEEEDNNNEPDNNAQEDNTSNSISKVDNKKIMKKEKIKRLVNTGIKTSKNHYLLALLIAIIGIIFVKRKNK